MRNKTYYAIKYKGDKTRWVVFSEHGWSLEKEFVPSCLISLHRMKSFMRTPPGLNDRYTAMTVSLGFTG